MMLGKRLLVFFVVALLLSGCFEDLETYASCEHDVWVTVPMDVDSAWMTLTCDDSVMLSNVDGALVGYEDELNSFNKEILSDNPVWHGKKEISCRLDMDVFCENERYPFVEYEWTFNQERKRMYYFHQGGDAGKKISKKNDVCGKGWNYLLTVWKPQNDCPD